MFDLVILGSGSAAFAAALKAADHGTKTAMIERGVLGGTGVNVGCVPSKNLLRAGELRYYDSHREIPRNKSGQDITRVQQSHRTEESNRERTSEGKVFRRSKVIALDQTLPGRGEICLSDTRKSGRDQC